MERAEVSRIVAGETAMTVGLIIVLIVIFVGVLGWLVYDVFIKQRELVNLVDDINDQIVDPLTRNIRNVHKLDTKVDAASAAVTAVDDRVTAMALDVSSNAANIKSDAQDAYNAALSLATVAVNMNTNLQAAFGVGGGSNSNLDFFNQATMLTNPGADFQLLKHTTAVGGLTVASTLDVSGGLFSVNAATKKATIGGAVFDSNSITFRDPSAAGAAAAYGVITAAGGSVAYDAYNGPAMLKSYGPNSTSTCAVDGAGGMYVANAPYATATGVEGAARKVFAIDKDDNVTLDTKGSITISGTAVNFTGGPVNFANSAVNFSGPAVNFAGTTAVTAQGAVTFPGVVPKIRDTTAGVAPGTMADVAHV